MTKSSQEEIEKKVSRTHFYENAVAGFRLAEADNAELLDSLAGRYVSFIEGENLQKSKDDSGRVHSIIKGTSDFPGFLPFWRNRIRVRHY